MIIKIQLFRDAEDEYDAEALAHDVVFYCKSVESAEAALESLAKKIGSEVPPLLEDIEEEY